jgi:hypothetical protein
VLLAEYDIVFMTRKVVKGSAIVDHFADHAVEDYESLNFDLPNKDVLTIKDNNEMNDWWTLYFDGAMNVSINEGRAVIISQKKKSNTLF